MRVGASWRKLARVGASLREFVRVCASLCEFVRVGASLREMGRASRWRHLAVRRHLAAGFGTKEDDRSGRRRISDIVLDGVAVPVVFESWRRPCSKCRPAA